MTIALIHNKWTNIPCLMFLKTFLKTLVIIDLSPVYKIQSISKHVCWQGIHVFTRCDVLILGRVSSSTKKFTNFAFAGKFGAP
jgi:hypothetical protein